MAIVTERFLALGPNSEVKLFMTYDNRNTTNDSRWRIQSISLQNDSLDRSGCGYVEDPANVGVRYPDADPNTAGWQPVFVPPGQTQSWDVPAQFQNDSPYNYNWGGGMT